MAFTWVTSDPHIGHQLIVDKWRHFATLEEHDAALVDRWNARVGDRDTVFVLGDVSLCKRPRMMEVAAQLKGQIKVVPGNHDSKTLLNGMREIGWEILPPYVRQHVGALGKCTMIHMPLATWEGRRSGAIHLHGHTHGQAPLWEGRTQPGVSIGVRVDVGMDAHGLVPWESEELFLYLTEERQRVQGLLAEAGECGVEM